MESCNAGTGTSVSFQGADEVTHDDPERNIHARSVLGNYSQKFNYGPNNHKNYF